MVEKVKREKKNDIAVYTAIFGSYDDLQDPPSEISGCDFYCFTDNPNLRSDTWQIIRVASDFDDKTRDARRVKTLSHKFLPEYEYTLWTDANVIFKNFDIVGLFQKFLKEHDVAIHLHQDRDCVYREASACIDRSIDSASKVIAQIVDYIYEGYPIKNGLAETTVVFRRNTDSVRRVNEDWWREIRTKSKRDQLSVDYVFWKNKLKYYGINKSVRNGSDFSVRDHNKNSYQERSQVLKIQKMEQTILEKEAIIDELKYSHFFGGFLLLKIKKIFKKITFLFKRFSVHLRNEGVSITLKRLYNFVFFGKGTIKKNNEDK